MKKALILIALLVIGGIAIAQLKYSDYSDIKMKVLESAPEQPEKEVVKTEEEWKEVLSKVEFHVLRKAGTEPANGAIYKDFKKHEEGEYYCVACGAHLFSSKTKFDSGSGWPSFYDAIHKNIKLDEDFHLGYKRVEVRCGKCDGHLGHVFEGEPYGNPTDKRYCINGVCLAHVPTESNKETEKKEDK